tara:strand:- start:1013 stop:1312 length:300 start_codon:yes stop_codon:yes gene_type:complete
MFSEHLAKGWYFMNGHAERQPFVGGRLGHVRTFCPKKEHETFILVSRKVLDKIMHEDEVSGFALHYAFDKPYPVYAVALNTTKIDRLLEKYKIDGALNT